MITKGWAFLVYAGQGKYIHLFFFFFVRTVQSVLEMSDPFVGVRGGPTVGPPESDSRTQGSDCRTHSRTPESDCRTLGSDRHTQVPRCPGTQVPRYPGTQVPRYPGTQVPRYPGTQVPRYPGTQVPRYPGPGPGTGTQEQEKSRERATTAPHDKHKSVQSRGAFMH